VVPVPPRSYPTGAAARLRYHTAKTVRESRPVSERPPLQTTSHRVEEGALAKASMPISARKSAVELAFQSSSGAPVASATRPLSILAAFFAKQRILRAFRPPFQVKHRLPAPADSPRISPPGREVQAMTDRRQLIRNASCWAVALSLAMALSTTESEAQPSGRPPSGPRPPSGRPPGPPHRRRGRRWGFGPRKHCWWGPHGRHCKWW